MPRPTLTMLSLKNQFTCVTQGACTASLHGQPKASHINAAAVVPPCH